VNRSIVWARNTAGEFAQLSPSHCLVDEVADDLDIIDGPSSLRAVREFVNSALPHLCNSAKFAEKPDPAALLAELVPARLLG
jgi:hypothetical protein